jgi:Ni/Co efflux regulator RcnB
MHRMRNLSIIAAAAICAALAAPAAGQQRFWIGPGPAPAIRPADPDGAVGAGSAWRRRDRDRRFHRRGRRPPERLPVRPFTPYPPYYYYEPNDDYDDEAVVPPAPPPAPVPPAAEAAPTELSPPDPRGEARFLPARGAAPAEPGYEIGAPLPPGLPQVTLDWRYYRLPEPPPGRIYVRVGRTVLLIEAASRIVEREVAPEAAGG